MSFNSGGGSGTHSSPIVVAGSDSESGTDLDEDDAELCGKLLEFVTWYKKAKKSPNLSKFAEATMPKGRGRKGGKGPRKRNSSVATTSRIQMPVAANPLVSSDCTLQDPLSASQISQTPECSSSSDGLAYQQSIAVSQTNTIQLPSQSNSFQMTFPSSVQPYAWPYTFNQPLQPSVSPPPFVSPPPLFPHQSSQESTTHPPSPFVLCKIVGNISICVGCRNRYHKPPTPPDNVCIRHQEWREYFQSGSQTPQSRYGNAYYHFNPHCVWLRWCWFTPSTLVIPSEIAEELGPSHKERLQSLFQIYLP